MSLSETMMTPLARCDIGAESRVLGALLLNRDIISDTMLKLNKDNFYLVKNQFIYESICSLFINGNPVTPETVANDLSKRTEPNGNRLDLVGGAEGILSIMEGVGVDEVDYWTRVVKGKYDERKMLEFVKAAEHAILSNTSTHVDDVRNKLEEKLVSLSGDNINSSSPISECIEELDDRINRYIDFPDEIVGMPTSFNKLDITLDGLQPGNVTIIYAPSSRFKSLFATNIGWRLAQQGYPGLWFTTEMPKVQVMERMLQLESGLNLKWLRRDKKVLMYKKHLKEAEHRLSKYPIYFCDTSALDVSEVRAEVNRQERWHGIEYIIVDLVDHISSSRFKDEMVNNQRAVMSAMKQIAKDFNIHVILVSHVNKGDRDTRNKADLDVESMTGSAAKYQDVDASISIGPSKLSPEGWVAMDRQDIFNAVNTTGTIDVMVAVTKNRHGELLRYLMTLDFNDGGRFSENLFKPTIVENEQLTLEE